MPLKVFAANSRSYSSRVYNSALNEPARIGDLSQSVEHPSNPQLWHVLMWSVPSWPMLVCCHQWSVSLHKSHMYLKPEGAWSRYWDSGRTSGPQPWWLRPSGGRGQAPSHKQHAKSDCWARSVLGPINSVSGGVRYRFRLWCKNSWWFNVDIAGFVIERERTHVVSSAMSNIR